MPTSGNDTLHSGQAFLIIGGGTSSGGGNDTLNDGEPVLIVGGGPLSGGGNDTLYNFDPAFIGGDDTLSGGGNDVIFNPGPPPHGLGTNGNDTLSTIRDFDWLVGLGGDDTYIVSHDFVLMQEEAGGGIDRVYSRVPFVLPAHVEILGLMDDAGNIDGTGNDLPNLIWGSLGNNTLHGAGGDDIVTGGGGGVDTLYGDAGNDLLVSATGPGPGVKLDSMYGGIGNNSYVVDNALDAVIESANEGIDVVIAQISLIIPKNVEYLIIDESAGAANGTGDNARNEIYGNSSVNALNGKGGHDRLFGNGGNDQRRRRQRHAGRRRGSRQAQRRRRQRRALRRFGTRSAVWRRRS